MTKFSSLLATTKLPPCITALMLFNHYEVDHSQHVSVVAAAAPTDDILNDSSTNDQCLSAATYKQVASVVKQCDRGSSSMSVNDSLTGKNVRFLRNRQNSHSNRNGERPGLKQPATGVLRRRHCHQCKKF